MNRNHSSTTEQALLVLAVKDTPKAQESLLIKAAKHQRYQKNTVWQVVLVLPSLLSYADAEQYHADWKSAMAHYETLAFNLSLSSEDIRLLHGNPRKLIRQYKNKYPGMVFINRTGLEKNLLITRWLMRKAKRKINQLYLSLRGRGGVKSQNYPEEYRGFLSTSFFL